jgi:hypothetical protein
MRDPLSIITVRKNWKKKIQAICAGVKEIKIYSLDNGFIGETANIPETDETAPEQYLENLVNSELGSHKSVSLTYIKETGAVCLRIHSNLWYTFENKIKW